jgi:ribosomal protein S24E
MQQVFAKVYKNSQTMETLEQLHIKIRLKGKFKGISQKKELRVSSFLKNFWKKDILIRGLKWN